MASGVLHCCSIPEVLWFPLLVRLAFSEFILSSSLSCVYCSHLGFPWCFSLICFTPASFLLRPSVWEAAAIRLVVCPFFNNIPTPPFTLLHLSSPSHFLSILLLSEAIHREFCMRESPLNQMLCQHLRFDLFITKWCLASFLYLFFLTLISFWREMRRLSYCNLSL